MNKSNEWNKIAFGLKYGNLVRLHKTLFKYVREIVLYFMVLPYQIELLESIIIPFQYKLGSSR